MPRWTVVVLEAYGWHEIAEKACSEFLLDYEAKKTTKMMAAHVDVSQPVLDLVDDDVMCKERGKKLGNPSGFPNAMVVNDRLD